MPRVLKSYVLVDAAKRAKLARDDKDRDTFWHELKLQTLALGWRRNGAWLVRRYEPDKWIEVIPEPAAIGPRPTFRRLVEKGGYRQWRLTFTSPDGKQKRCIADDYKPANGKDILSFKQAEERAIVATEPKSAEKLPITVKEACIAYVTKHLARERKRSREIGLTFELQVYGDKAVHPIGHIAVRDLTRTILEDWKHAQADRPKSNGERRSKGDVNRALAYLKAALNFAYSDGTNDIPSDKAWARKTGVKPLPDASKSRCDFYLDPGQVQRLLAVTEGGLHNLVKVSFLVGLRPPHEAAGIRCKDFDAERGIVKIEQSKTKRREVTLSSEAREFFTELCQDKRPNDLLFTQDNGRPVGRRRRARQPSE